MTKAMQRSTEENVRESDGELVDKKKKILKRNDKDGERVSAYQLCRRLVQGFDYYRE
jgi:hypothetical protein